MKIRQNKLATFVIACGLIWFIWLEIQLIEDIIAQIISWRRVEDMIGDSILAIGSLWGIGVLVTMLCDQTCIVTVDENGVRNRNRFYEECLTWEEIKDYGYLKGQIYFSGRRFSSEERLRLHKVALLRPESCRELMWYPTVIREKKNQKKRNIIIRIEYTDERWDYVCSLTSQRKELLEKYLEELENDL